MRDNFTVNDLKQKIDKKVQFLHLGGCQHFQPISRITSTTWSVTVLIIGSSWKNKQKVTCNIADGHGKCKRKIPINFLKTLNFQVSF